MLCKTDDIIVKREALEQAVDNAIHRFPKHFDRRLQKGFHLLMGSLSDTFLEGCLYKKLQRILLTQFSLQKQIESLLENNPTDPHQVLVRLFESSSHICLAIAITLERDHQIFNETFLLKGIQTLVPGIIEIPQSFYSWRSPEFSYVFCYVELQKVRGKPLYPKDLKKLKGDLTSYFQHAAMDCTPSVFWPYNHEEAYRQIVTLHKEIQKIGDLPQVSIHFQAQTTTELEYLIHIVAPKQPLALKTFMDQFPRSCHVFPRLIAPLSSSVASEAMVVSLFVPVRYFETRRAINLLHARRYVVKLLQQGLGEFRDFNGGLFRQLQKQFDAIERHLGSMILNFPDFAEKLFYSLSPIESVISCSYQDLVLLFTEFANTIDKENSCSVTRSGNKTLLIIRTQDPVILSDKLALLPPCPNELIHGQIYHRGYYYLCCLDISGKHQKLLAAFKDPQPILTNPASTLTLPMPDNIPSTLNPYFQSTDLISRILSKHLFEGLTRIGTDGRPKMAGAKAVHISDDGLTHTFTLRKHYWSNGKRVLASDYVKSWLNFLRQPSRPNIEAFSVISGIKENLLKENNEEYGFKELNSNVLQIELAYPDPFILEKLAQPIFFPLSGEEDEPKYFNGPYHVHQHTRDQFILARNPYFWDTEKTYFEQIIFQGNQNKVNVNQRFINKEIDWLGEPFSTLVTGLDQFKPINKHVVSRCFWIFVNTQFLPLSSSYIRRALSLVIDRKYITEHILVGDKPLHSPLPINLSHQDYPLEKPQYEQAIELFERGLLELGLTRQAIPAIKFYCTSAPSRMKLAQYLKQVWETTLGIPVEITALEWDNLIGSLEKGNFHLAGCTQSSILRNPIVLLQRFEENTITNFSQWTHLNFQKKFTQAKKQASVNPKMVNSLEDILIEQMPVIPISNRVHYFTHHPKLTDYVIDQTGSVDFRWAYIKEEKPCL